MTLGRPQQVIADLLDAELDHDANRLLELLDVGGDDEIRQALVVAKRRLDEIGDDE